VAQGGQLGTQVEAKNRVHKSPQPAWPPPCMVVTDGGTAQVPPVMHLAPLQNFPFSMQDVERDTSSVVNPVGLSIHEGGYLFLANLTGDLHRVDLPIQ
jgi:hypothetical protein